MARQESLNVLDDLTTPAGKMFLKEQYKGVIGNVQKEALSVRMKNTDLSGDPDSGSVEAKRFQNANSKPYGTARREGKGDAVKGRPVTVKIDVDREFVEELEKKDTRLLGVEGLVEKRTAEHQLGMIWELDAAFFAEAKASGIQYLPKPTLATTKDIIEKAIVQLEKTHNDYIRGINRGLMTLVCDEDTYSEMRDYLDTLQNSNVASDVEKFRAFHGVVIESSNNLPQAVIDETTGEVKEPAVKFVLMMNQSIAQPVISDTYSAEKIGQSNAYSVQLFYSYGTKAVTPETILWYDGTKAPANKKDSGNKPADKPSDEDKPKTK